MAQSRSILKTCYPRYISTLPVDKKYTVHISIYHAVNGYILFIFTLTLFCNINSFSNWIRFMIFGYTSYRDFLHDSMANLKKNKRLSLNSVAKKTGISPALLSAIINGRKNLSEKTLNLIGIYLKLNREELYYLELLAEHEHAPTKEYKSNVWAKLIQIRQMHLTKKYSGEDISNISEWYHFAIIELLQNSEKPVTFDNLSHKLGLPISATENAIKALLEKNIIHLTENKLYRKACPYFTADSQAPNINLRHFHKSTLEKAIESIETQNPNEKFIGSETFCFDPKLLPKANQIIEECFSQLIYLASQSENKQHVYHAGIQLFRLTMKESP